MCFSAEASFISGSVLLAVGAITLKQVKNTKQVMLAAVPLIFGLQQLTEGIIWIALSDSQFQSWRETFMLAFLIFAQVIWPFWIPGAFALLEKNAGRKKILRVVWIQGSLISVYLFYCLFHYPITIGITNHHISYNLEYPNLYGLGVVLYLIPTVFSAFISSLKWASLLGLLNFISLVITKVFYKEHVLSVWCFFAAILSVFIYLLLRDLNNKDSRG
jgi:hypothetical protein